MGITDFISFGSSDRRLQLYSNASVLLNGTLITQHASITLEKKSNDIPITTLGGGFAGVSLGAGVAELTIQSAIPSADLEWNPDLFVRTGKVVEGAIVVADRQTVFKGSVTEAIYAHSVNKEATLQIKLLCRLTDFE